MTCAWARHSGRCTARQQVITDMNCRIVYIIFVSCAMSAMFNINSHSRDDSSSSLLNLRGPFVCRGCIAISVPKLASIVAGRIVALQRTEAVHMPSNRTRRHARGGRRCSRPKRGRVGCSRERPWVVRILPWKRQYFPCMRSQIHRTRSSTYIDHGRYGHD